MQMDLREYGPLDRVQTKEEGVFFWNIDDFESTTELVILFRNYLFGDDGTRGDDKSSIAQS